MESERVACRGLGGVRELALVVLALTAVAVAVYWRGVVDGGFLSDGWAILAAFEFNAPAGGPWDVVLFFLEYENISVRPLQAFYLVALLEAFGSDARLWLGWQLATNVSMATLLYVLLRRLSLRRLDAGFIAALVLIFPAASSVRFWTPTIWAPLSISMVLGGFLLALSAFETEHRRPRLTRHAFSLLLFVASLLLYEVTLLVMLASVLLYRLRVPWRAAARRWLVDCAVLLPIVPAVTLSTSVRGSSESGVWQHALTIAEEAWVLLATVVLPFGSARWYLLPLLALVPATALLVYRRLPSSNPARAELGRWLVAIAGGLVVVALGYAIYAPGIDYYAPMGPGIADRVNAVPSLGWVVVVYAAAMLIGCLAFRRLPRGASLASGFAISACGLLAVGWLKTLSDYSDLYTRAYAENIRVLDTVRAAVPDPPPHSMIWTFGQPVELSPGIPVFGNTWDMTFSAKLAYGDPTIESYVGFPGTTFRCRRGSIVPGGNENYMGQPPIGASADSFASAYGRTYFVDATTGRAQRIGTPGQCKAAARSFSRSPALARAPRSRPAEAATFTVACDDEGDAIEYKVYGEEAHETLICRVRIGPQEGLEGIDLTNVGPGTERGIALDAQVKGIDWEQSWPCGEEAHSDGVWSGSITLAGIG